LANHANLLAISSCPRSSIFPRSAAISDGRRHPEEIAQYAQSGVDMMDCVLPTRAARHGLLFTSEARSIKQARYAQDESVSTRLRLPRLPALSAPTSAISTLERAAGTGLDTVHNLHYYLATMRTVRRGSVERALPPMFRGREFPCRYRFPPVDARLARA